MTYYEISNYGLEIKKVTVLKETEKMVTVQRETWDKRLMEEKRKKKTSYSRLYQTFDEAKQALVDRLTKNREYHELEIKRVAINLKKVLDITETV